MNYALGDIFSLLNERFMVAETAVYMGVNYLLLNKLDNKEDPTKELYVYKEVNNGLVKVTDENILEIIIPVFNNKLEKDIKNVQNENKYNIN